MGLIPTYQTPPATHCPSVCSACASRSFDDWGIALADGPHGAAQVWRVRCQNCGKGYDAVMYLHRAPTPSDWKAKPFTA